ncbi:helix-turn-helix domain-containing protein [Gemmatimonadota bacterium]
MDDALLTTSEAAEILGRHPATIRRWVREGSIPGLGVRVGSVTYIRRTALEDLVGCDLNDDHAQGDSEESSGDDVSGQ